jgi:hypothetical protein
MSNALTRLLGEPWQKTPERGGNMTTCAMRRSVATLTLVVTALAQVGLARDAEAFCGFYVSSADGRLTNNATQVVLMREGQRTVLSMQNGYQGPPQDFAMVVPVPVVLQKENVKTLPRDVFDRIDQLTAPRLVEYWEQDPCPQPAPPMAAGGLAPPAPRAMMASAEMAVKREVKIEAQFTVGEYDVVVLSATDSTALDSWLRDHHYKIPAGAEPYLRPYVELGMKFFVAKVDVNKVKFERVGNGPEQAILSPLRFHYDADSFSLPIRLGLINSGGTQDLVVTVLARGQRYEVANYDNVAIPTNIDVSDGARERFASFYATLFDETIQRHPRTVVTEYSWAAQSCDPCPTPPLQPSDLMTLGADALPSSAPAQSQPTGRPLLAPMPGRQFPGGFVVTRLHARYSKDALGDDLVFRAAPPIVGGREFMQTDGKLEQGARPDATNNFQARYAIRHAWTGPITCKEPRRGVWGGPPGRDAWSSPQPSAKPASKIGFLPRGGALTLASFVRGPLPPESILSRGGVVAPLAILPGDASAPVEDASAAQLPAAADASSILPAPPPTTPPRSGCAGCGIGGGDGAAMATLAAFGALVLARLRRRKA